MKKSITLIQVLAFSLISALAFADTPVTHVTGRALGHSAMSAYGCCEEMRDPRVGVPELNDVCRLEGGHYVINVRFVPTEHCVAMNDAHAFKCIKLVEADCVK